MFLKVPVVEKLQVTVMSASRFNSAHHGKDLQWPSKTRSNERNKLKKEKDTLMPGVELDHRRCCTSVDMAMWRSAIVKLLNVTQYGLYGKQKDPVGHHIVQSHGGQRGLA